MKGFICMLEDRLQYTFKNKGLLIKALTHSSYSNEKGEGRLGCNERLEFLGDSLLGFIVAEYLYMSYREKPEGEMTKLRSELVCEPSLVRVAKRLQLGEHLLLGKGEEQGGGRNRASILADALEAVIAAIYLDGGKKAAERFVKKHILDGMGKDEKIQDYKTTLQEIVQKNGGESPTYRLVGEAGPDHDKVFYAEVLIKGELRGRGSGKSKKEAEQAAAEAALESIIK
jgi:ribonuclease-3